MCYLSPFACYGVRPDIGASESNLSSSGYSSMASPGPSPSCSSKTLCISHGDDSSLARAFRKCKERPMLHRALSPSLESSSPPLDSPVKFCQFSNRMRMIPPSDSESTDDRLTIEPVFEQAYDSNDEGIDVEHVGNSSKVDESGELTSAKDLEHLLIAANREGDAQKGLEPKFLNVSKVQKTRSLDSKLKGERHNRLKVNVCLVRLNQGVRNS